MNVRGDNVVVSIWCPTYNHKTHIRNCLQGFVSQITTFPIEVLVHDDASTDGTAEIVREFEIKYPFLIRGIYQADNQLSKSRAHLTKTVLHEAKGEYIALCEGDDYWTDPFKLQKQIDLMISNRSIAMTFHNAKEMNNSSEKLIISGYQTGYVNPSDIIQKKIRIPTLSMVFVRNLDIDLSLIDKIKSGDRYLEIASIVKGSVYYFNEVLGVKRTLPTGLLAQYKNKRHNSTIEKYYSNIELIDLLPNYLKKYMHRYLFGVCIQVLKSGTLKSVRFWLLAIKHYLLSIIL